MLKSFTETRLKGVRKRLYFGLQMFDLTPSIKPTVKATMALSSTEKIEFQGSLSFDRHEGSYQYPNEVVISVWSHGKPVFKERAVNDGYYRVEIPVPQRVFTKMCERALEKLWLLEEESKNI